MSRFAVGVLMCAALGSAASSPLLIGLSVAVSASLATPDVAEAAEVQGEEREGGEEQEIEAATIEEEVVADEEAEAADEVEEGAADEVGAEEFAAAAVEEDADEEDYSEPPKSAGSPKVAEYATLARKSLPALAVATSGLVVAQLGSMLLSRGSGKVYKVRRAVRRATAPAVGLPPLAPVKYVPKESDQWLDRQLDRLLFWLKARFAKPKAD